MRVHWEEGAGRNKEGRPSIDRHLYKKVYKGNRKRIIIDKEKKS